MSHKLCRGESAVESLFDFYLITYISRFCSRHISYDLSSFIYRFVASRAIDHAVPVRADKFVSECFEWIRRTVMLVAAAGGRSPFCLMRSEDYLFWSSFQTYCRLSDDIYKTSRSSGHSDSCRHCTVTPMTNYSPHKICLWYEYDLSLIAVIINKQTSAYVDFFCLKSSEVLQ